MASEAIEYMDVYKLHRQRKLKQDFHRCSIHMLEQVAKPTRDILLAKNRSVATSTNKKNKSPSPTTQHDGRYNIYQDQGKWYSGEEKGSWLPRRRLESVANLGAELARVAFMVYTLDQGDQWAMAEDIQVLLFDENLRFFNDVFREEAEFRPNITLMALRQLTAIHCPPGTRGVLMDELMQLRKKKGTNVREYSREFRTLLRMFPFLEHGENEAVPEADIVRMYKLGMPVDWQVELHHQQPRQRQNERSRNNQRPRNNNQGRNDKYCSFCKRNNHNGNECFRDPASPAYRPRNSGGAQYQPNRNHQTKTFGGGNRNAYNNTNNSSMTAMQGQIAEMAAMMKTLKQRQDDDSSRHGMYELGAGSEDPECTPRRRCLEPETAKYRNADNSIGQTTHRATSTLKLLAFSNTRTCTHSFRVAETLLYPVMLGKDFMWKQKMVIDFEDGTLKWDGIEIKMATGRSVQKRAAAVLAADMECRAEIAVDEPEEGPPSDLIAT
ncbi:hypothetical protein GN958_ATG23092 [Phytophthora infestans]|uniref:Uncharacterized protein n=1 Tax=Phytophthora infestans TaxID=4787 RepID=A0A8S9TGI9_PHYIN|nr:hypothetical protein GN958_ATG23092 [Phytophthora infestans]